MQLFIEIVEMRINMSEKTNTEVKKGQVTYDDKVIEKIVGQSLESINGLLGVTGGAFTGLKNKVVNSDDVTEGVNVEVGTKEVAVDLRIIVEYSKDILEIVENIKEVVSEEVKDLTHLKVVEVNVEVVDIMTREDYQASSVTVQDRLTDAGKATGEFVSEQSTKASDKIKSQVESAKSNQ